MRFTQALNATPVLFTFLVVLLPTTPTGTSPQLERAVGNSSAAWLDSVATSLMRDFSPRGMAVALIDDGAIALERYYGFADAERQVPVTGETLFNVASVSKAVSAFGVLRLVDQGQIGLDEPALARIRRWQPPASEFPATEVTVARLLSHTAGVSRHTTGIWAPDDTLPTLEAALDGNNGGYGDTRIVAQPGTRWSYSGGGYSILQLLVEETTGQSFIDYMNERVLRPLGITRSRYGWSPEVLRHLAVSYSEFGDPLPGYRSVEVAAGGFNATVGDLARFAIALAPQGNGPGRLQPATRTRMTSPAPNAVVNPTAQFGLGVLRTSLPDGRTLLMHDGGNPGWGALFAIDPATGDGIVVLVNRSWGGQVFFPILCEWQKVTAPPSSPPRNCGRDVPGLVLNTLAVSGRDSARQRYESFRSRAPQSMNEAAMLRMSRQLMYAERFADAAALLGWHLSHDSTAAPIHDRLGDVLRASGDTTGARGAWTAALRHDPNRADTRAKLDSLTARP
jgi:CubicO group peptidase (beta-lactamase class C family)